MFWECKSSSLCECGGLDRLAPSSFRPRLFSGVTEDLAEQWQATVLKYAPLTVTVSSDKLPALSGIAARFSEHVKSRYLAGLWEEHLPQKLLWVVDWSPLGGPPTDNLFVPVRSQPYRAPTWSWASIDLANSHGNYGCPIRWGEWDIYIDSRFAILRAECVIVGDNPFGYVSFGLLKIRAAYLTPDPELTKVQLHSRVYKLVFGRFSRDEEQRSEHLRLAFFADTISPIRLDEGVQPQPVFQVLIISSALGIVVKLVKEEPSKGAMVGIEIKAEKGEKENYCERVGLISLHELLPIFHGAEEGIFSLV
jgi:hypothetical protein